MMNGFEKLRLMLRSEVDGIEHYPSRILAELPLNEVRIRLGELDCNLANLDKIASDLARQFKSKNPRQLFEELDFDEQVDRVRNMKSKDIDNELFLQGINPSEMLRSVQRRNSKIRHMKMPEVKNVNHHVRTACSALSRIAAVLLVGVAFGYNWWGAKSDIAQLNTKIQAIDKLETSIEAFNLRLAELDAKVTNIGVYAYDASLERAEETAEQLQEFESGTDLDFERELGDRAFSEEANLAPTRDLQILGMTPTSIGSESAHQNAVLDIESGASIRSEPSVNSRRIGLAYHPEEIEVVGRSPDDNWVRVKVLENGAKGYVRRDLVRSSDW